MEIISYDLHETLTWKSIKMFWEAADSDLWNCCTKFCYKFLVNKMQYYISYVDLETANPESLEIFCSFLKNKILLIS